MKSNIINKRLYNTLIIYSLVYIFTTLVIYIKIINKGLILMLGFNVFLALIPLLLIRVLINTYEDKKVQAILIFTIWLLFLPNTFYVITDLIHLSKNIYYTQGHIYAPIVYRQEIKIWLELLIIFIGIIIALFNGLYSLILCNEYLKINNIKKNNYVIALISLLSSIGIYIGRFLRFHSWHVIFKPLSLVKQFISSLNGFSFVFILLFYIVHLVLFNLFRVFFLKME